MSPRARSAGEPDASVFDAYRRTIIEVEDGAGQRQRIPPGSPPPKPLSRFGVFHVITAWNPTGPQRSRAENDAAQSALRTEVEGRGTRVASARGHDPDGCWDAEESVAIWGLSRTDAIELGRRHGQNAIFEVNADGPQVLDCAPGAEGAR